MSFLCTYKWYGGRVIDRDDVWHIQGTGGVRWHVLRALA
jgi:hypothetical protein